MRKGNPLEEYLCMENTDDINNTFMAGLPWTEGNWKLKKNNLEPVTTFDLESFC